jgi:hypothetical protein
VKPTTPIRESNTPQKHAHDRLVFLYSHFIGRTATITVKSGEQFVGLFSGTSADPSGPEYTLKMARRLKKATMDSNSTAQDDTEAYLGRAPDHAMKFGAKEVVNLEVQNVNFSETAVKQSNGKIGFITHGISRLPVL